MYYITCICKRYIYIYRYIQNIDTIYVLPPYACIYMTQMHVGMAVLAAVVAMGAMP